MQLRPWLVPYYQQFVNAMRQGRMTGSIIIAGDQGLGVNELAFKIAEYFLCHNKQEQSACGSCVSCQNFKRYNHQDLKVAYPSTGDEKSAGADFTYDLRGLLIAKDYKDYRTLRIDTMRKVSEFLQATAVGGRGKAVIITDAQTMNEAAANAILKTFEEPYPDSLIIMVTSSLELLLPTILSRALKVVVHEVPVAQASAFLLSKENQHPDFLDALDNNIEDYADSEYPYSLEQALESVDCSGLQTPIDQKRVEIALALNSYAPLRARDMLLTGTDLQAINVINLLIKNVRSSEQDEAEVIAALQQLTKKQQSSLLSELILEILKYKAHVPIESLPLIYYPQAQVLAKLKATDLFDSMDKLRYVEDRPPLIASRAPIALLRAWLKGFKGQI